MTSSFAPHGSSYPQLKTLADIAQSITFMYPPCFPFLLIYFYQIMNSDFRSVYFSKFYSFR